MDAFGRIKGLAEECFRDKPGYKGVLAEEKENYIGIAISETEDIFTEVLCNPEEESARILTFDPEHAEESMLSERLKEMGIQANVEVYKRSELLSSKGIPQSPSGRAQKERFDLIMGLYSV